jgi:hypothetical protein
MCETIKELLSLGIVPICNENDVFYRQRDLVEEQKRPSRGAKET